MGHKWCTISLVNADLLFVKCGLIATVDDERREIRGGWIACTDGIITAIGTAADPTPEATRTIDASDQLVTPGPVSYTHLTLPTKA